MTLEYLNVMATAEASLEFTRCCGSSRWVQEMINLRPFRSKDELFLHAGRTWRSLTNVDWKEAFTHHPKIGDIESLTRKFAGTAAWASGEQSGAMGAPEETLIHLAERNRSYEEKFGYIFIVCATGKSAEEMLAILRSRLPNSPDVEMGIAAEEQAKITRIRLEKLLSP